MAIGQITLGGGLRDTLSSLQLTTALMSQTQTRLATGRRVNSSVDDPVAFFAAQSLQTRAGQLDARKQQIGEGIQTVKAADAGVSGITALIEQARGIADSARSAAAGDIVALETQYDAILTQIDELAGDAGYKGINLLAGASSITVSFNEGGTSSLTITGFDASSGGLSISAADFTDSTTIDLAVGGLDAAVSTLRTNAQTLSANSSVLSVRQDFISSMVNTLQTGADNLVVADANEEGANMLALQTRQQLGIVALGLSAQVEQSILRLF